ncbi:TetR/AcrR family transcriptional regulator [Streptomyces sp. AK02-01A]|uniref:TetR/AcrR family transcriptional regulator n=1 Tax=Streptomyces sp. AK02-01A TaxID=3028648 RepID=UPI0029AD79E3|nr:TetR/AcrR family transcriptional regulator [Streptomyces sp. AK02-01A]MDX3853462.1 TetR/AcrR family transcriptional regulator [Streptomyces sp. AK02-01A]
MSVSPKVDRVKERLVQTASELFYSRGINATGVDLICEVAGVSKRSMYKRFAGKDELVAEYLTGTGTSILAGYLPADDHGSPVARILSVFAAAQRDTTKEDFRGCPLINAAAELSVPSHPARTIAADYKLDLQAYFTRQAALAGAREPEALAEQLAILFDGGLAYALVRRTVMPTGIMAAAKAIIDTQIAVEPRPEEAASDAAADGSEAAVLEA